MTLTWESGIGDVSIYTLVKAVKWGIWLLVHWKGISKVKAAKQEKACLLCPLVQQINDTVRSFEASTSACSWKASLVRKIIFSRIQEVRGKTLCKSVTSWPTGSQAEEHSFPMDFCLSCLIICFPALTHHQSCPSFVPAAPGREHSVVARVALLCVQTSAVPNLHGTCQNLTHWDLCPSVKWS